MTLGRLAPPVTRPPRSARGACAPPPGARAPAPATRARGPGAPGRRRPRTSTDAPRGSSVRAAAGGAGTGSPPAGAAGAPIGARVTRGCARAAPGARGRRRRGRRGKRTQRAGRRPRGTRRSAPDIRGKWREDNRKHWESVPHSRDLSSPNQAEGPPSLLGACELSCPSHHRAARGMKHARMGKRKTQHKGDFLLLLSVRRPPSCSLSGSPEALATDSWLTTRFQDVLSPRRLALEGEGGDSPGALRVLPSPPVYQLPFACLRLQVIPPCIRPRCQSSIHWGPSGRCLVLWP